jgi:hypothetical protein
MAVSYTGPDGTQIRAHKLQRLEKSALPRATRQMRLVAISSQRLKYLIPIPYPLFCFFLLFSSFEEIPQAICILYNTHWYSGISLILASPLKTKR